MLVSGEPASAHVDVQPRLVEQGAVAEMRVELPGIEPKRAPVRLEIEGDGVEVLSTRQIGARGPETLWSARLRVNAPPGRLELLLRPVYADGDAVEFVQVLTVVPAAETSSFPWAVVAGGTVLALAAAAATLVVARRRA